MPSIADIKQQYPDLSDLDDNQVVDAVHEAFYRDMPRDEVAKSLGVKPAPAPVEPRSMMRVAGDVGISALKGAIAVPESAVGLADIVTGGQAGKLAEDAGFRPKEAKAMLDAGYSDQQKEAFRQVQAADGLGDTFMAAVRNPSVVAHSVVESLPSMGAGGVLARGGLALAPKLGGVTAAALGEGAVGAGSAAEQIRQQTDNGLLTGQQAGLALATGAATTGFAMLGGKIAKKLGIADVDTMLTGAATYPAMRKGVVRSALEGAVSEGLLEELPQSVSEQVLQNIALGRPIDEGVNQAAVLGTLSGSAMGSGANVLSSFGGDKQQPGVTPAAPAAPAGPLARAAGAVAPGTTESIAAAAGPMPVDDPVAETIQSLPDGVREKAMRAYAAINNPDVAKGVRIYNQKLLDGLLEQVAGDAQAGLEKVQKDGAAIDSSAPAATEKIAPKTTSVDPSTGEIVTAFDQREADRPKQQPDDILNAQNKPFTNMGAAKKTAQALGDGFAPFKLGANAFVVRAKPKDDADVQDPAPRAAAQTQAAPAQAPEAGKADEAGPATAGPEAGTGVVEASGVDASTDTVQWRGNTIPRANLEHIKRDKMAVLRQVKKNATASEGTPNGDGWAKQVGETQAVLKEIDAALSGTTDADNAGTGGPDASLKAKTLKEIEKMASKHAPAQAFPAQAAIKSGTDNEGSTAKKAAVPEVGAVGSEGGADVLESGITSANSKGGNRPGEAATSGAPGGDGRGAPAPQLDLTSPSPAEVVAQQGRAETAAKAETLDFDNGEPVRVPAGATDQQIAAATSERAPEAGNRAADVGAAGGQSGLFANEPAADYTDAYEADLFGEPLPKPQRKAGAAQPAQPRLRGNVQPADTPAPERAEFYVNTLIGSEVSRELGAARIVTPEQAAQATRYLYKSAVERFDGIVTDKSGKPIAVIGGFKGAVGQASVYPGTLMAEAIRIPGAANVWFSHNHPGGKAVLSRADVALNATLSDVFRGSGIEPMGLLAVSGNEFSHVSALGEGEYNPVKTFQPSIIKKMVPVMERQLEESPPQAPISSPTDAKAVAKIFYDKNKEPGILLLSSQHAPVGWLPISEVMMGPLRGSGGAASIYRAVSQSNAASAIIVHGGELDATVARSGVTVSQNIAAALKKVDVLPLDSINAVDGQSAAESGFDLALGPMFSRQVWRSALKDGISAMTTNAAPAMGWQAAIKGLVNKGAVKADEVEWSGVTDWLKLQTGKVTKQQVLDYLDGNGVQITETVLGEKYNEETRKAHEELWEYAKAEYSAGRESRLTDAVLSGESIDAIEQVSQSDTPDAAQLAMAYVDAVRKTVLPTKYSQYQIPGATNYREVLLTLPAKDTITEKRVASPPGWGDTDGGNVGVERTGNTGADYRSSHWDQPNVLAHIRLNDRTDADGKRVLFVEEIQSDWGQAGKKNGFAGEPSTADLKIEQDGNSFNVLRNGVAIWSGINETRANEVLAREFAKKDSGIHIAPFVGKTDAWVMLALKRIIKMAADEGYDKVAFINGEQSAVRYSLDKQVDSIQYRKAGADAYEMSIIARGGGAIESIPKPVNGKFYTTAEVEEIIGKEMVSKMDAEEGKSIASGPWRKLEGDDLKLEAKGMRAFYDKIVPSVAKDVLRKLGGGQMETVNLRGSESKDALAQTGFTITDKMKEHASKGMPMFSRSTPEERNALKALSENDDLFALPKSDSKTVEGITADAKAGITVKKEKDTVGRTVYTFTMDDGKTATMSVRPFNPYATEEAPTLYGYTLKDGEMTGLAIERPGNNPEEAGNLDDVWVDVSRLKAGSGGLAIYNIAQTYAHNTGRIFIGDPAGLTDAALRRRTEQMLSSALKFGTTKHLAPHPRQVEGDKALGIPPLQWTYGDDLGNIESLIQTSLASYNHVNPLTFEPSTGRFLDSEGHELDADAIRQIAEVGPGRAAGAGRTTLQRAAIFESLVRERGGESGGARAGAGVLERLVELARQFGASTHKVFYSRGDTSASGASSVEARASTAEVERIVAGITSRWTNAPEVVVVHDMQDPRIPAKVREADQMLRSGGTQTNPDAFFIQNKVYLVAPNVGTPQKAAELLLHEALGHYGLRNVFGDQLKPLLGQLAALRRADVLAKAEEYGLPVTPQSVREKLVKEQLSAERDAFLAELADGTGADLVSAYAKAKDRIDAAITEQEVSKRLHENLVQAAEEVLAEMAQARPEIGFVKRAIAIIRSWLRRNIPGFKNIALTDAEIINDYLLPARGFVERGMADRSGAARGMAPAFWRGTNEAMKNKDVVGKTQGGRSADDISPGVLTDEKGKPITLYHGGLVWDKFESEKSGRDALWLTPSVADASGYADQYSKKDGREIKAFHVTMNKPLDLTNTKVVDQVFGEDNAPTAAEMARDRQLIEQALKYAKKNGYDGMIHPDSDNLNRYSNGRISYAVFSKDQLQLAPLTGNEQDSNTYGIPLRSKLNEPTAPESGGVTMKEIEALNDTPTVAIMKEAVDAIGETEFQRRVKKKTEKVTANGKFQASESMLVEATAREVVAISRRNGDFDGGKADIRFSRTAISTAANRVADKLNETFSHPGKLNWWHKSFGTMNNLAERSPAFKPVFNAAQNFINDVSYYATEAADLAPKMLPKLDKWSDLFKSPITAADNKAISAPIFEGTLSWARDEQGKPVRMDDLEATYAKLSDEEKAQMLLKKRFVTEGELKRWKASPLDIYEGAVRNRFKTNFLTPGVVWKDAELVSLFKLTPEQISLYREFLAATDKSLDNLAKADMLRFGGKDVAHLQDMVMDAKDADEAAVMLRDYLHSLRDLMPEKVDELNNTASGMIERADKVNKLKAQGYAPLSRFGKYTVDVVVDGERQFFSLFETVRDANKMAAKMKMEYGAANVAQGTLSESEFKLFAGITPESLELFGNMLGLDSTGDAARDKAFQTYLKLTKTNRSAMRRMIHRKGIAGFSEDAGRVLAAFVYSNARQTSAALHMSGMGDAINDIPKSQGELKDAAIALADYIKSPQEEAQAIRGLLFAQHLGGSVASAFVNMMQPFAVTFPWLSQYGGAKQSGEQLLRAMKDMATKGFVYEPELAKALHKAEELGIVSPQEVHQLMAQARGASSLKPGDGTRTGDAMAKASNALSRLSFGWGQVFGMAEQLNRRSTFIAAYRVAKAQGMKNPADFAKKAVNDTQFIYNRGNKMRFGRGAVGATLMTFKTFSIAYMELLSRMYSQGGPEGKKAVLLALGVMLLMGGAGGLPFAEDAEDLVDGMLQRLGYNVSIKKAKQEFLENLFGKAGADFVERGVSGLPGMPLDVSGRLGMGNLVPGTGLFKSKSSHARDLGELAGPAGDFGRRLFEAGGQVLGGDVVKAALTASPVAVRNAAKGLDMAGTGMYRDDKGYKVLDTSLLEAAFKSIGFQPATVAKVQEANFINQQAKNFYSQTAADIRARWAKGIFEKDPGQIEAARDMIRIWNEKNPDQPIRPNMPAILKRVREMSKSKDQRIADTAPKAMRVQMRLDMAERRAAQE